MRFPNTGSATRTSITPGRIYCHLVAKIRYRYSKDTISNNKTNAINILSKFTTMTN